MEWNQLLRDQCQDNFELLWGERNRKFKHLAMELVNFIIQLWGLQ